MTYTRNDYLMMSDDALLLQCRCDCFRARGPGGQHRNTTDSAVRLTLDDPEITIAVTEAASRSQQRNRAAAIKKLRLEIALLWRTEPCQWSEEWKIGQKDRRYAMFTATVLDAIEAAHFHVSTAAAYLGISTAVLVKILARDVRLWRLINDQRKKKGLKPLVHR